MPPTNRLKTFYLTHLIKPASDRVIYRTLLQEKFGRIVELGVGNGDRALRMIEIAAGFLEAQNVQYVGIDPFEARTPEDEPGMSLLEAYRVLRQSGAKIKLIPGDPCEGLSRSANTLHAVDLLLISPPRDVERLNPMWFFVPRILHERSVVLLESREGNGTKSIRQIDLKDIAHWATSFHRRKAA